MPRAYVGLDVFRGADFGECRVLDVDVLHRYGGVPRDAQSKRRRSSVSDEPVGNPADCLAHPPRGRQSCARAARPRIRERRPLGLRRGSAVVRLECLLLRCDPALVLEARRVFAGSFASTAGCRGVLVPQVLQQQAHARTVVATIGFRATRWSSPELDHLPLERERQRTSGCPGAPTRARRAPMVAARMANWFPAPGRERCPDAS